jgi:hypothetical protein
MIFVANASRAETIVGEMKTPKPIRRISEKQKAKLIGSGSFQFNSTLRRNPCNAITAARSYKTKSAIRNTCKHSDSISALQGQTKTNSSQSAFAEKDSSASFGNQRKPVKRQSEKQKARLQKLAAVHLNWWTESVSSGKPLICGICDEEIRSFEDLASDHINPGLAKSDDISNLQPANKLCNFLKGSRRNFMIVPGTNDWKLIHGLL